MTCRILDRQLGRKWKEMWRYESEENEDILVD